MARGRSSDARDIEVLRALDRGEKPTEIARANGCSYDHVKNLKRALRELDGKPGKRKT